MTVYENSSDILYNPDNFIPNYYLVKETLKYFSAANCLILYRENKATNANIIKVQESFSRVKDQNTTNKYSLPIPELDQYEPIHKTLFTIYNMPSLLQEYWSSRTLNSSFCLVHCNEFVPNLSEIDYVKRYDYDAPINISPNPVAQVWIYTSKLDKEPLIHLKCELVAKDLKISIGHAGIKSYSF